MSYPNISLERLTKTLHLNSAPVASIINKNWIVSFSGGADSVLTLFFLLTLHQSRKKQRKLVLYILDHGQTFTKDNDAKRKNIFDRYLTHLNSVENLSVEVEHHSRLVAKIAKRISSSFEHTGSRIRRKQLLRLSRKHKNCVVITGHTLTDWYETLIMRINRGSSAESMAPFDFIETFENVLSINDYNGGRKAYHATPIVRPLHLTSRFEIRQFCSANKIEYWDDPSNKDTSILRNSIRKAYTVENANGLRISAKLQIKKKIEYQCQLQPHLQDINLISKNREYRFPYKRYVKLPANTKISILRQMLRLVSTPISGEVQRCLPSIPIDYKNIRIEYEAWNQSVFIVVRKGRKKLNLSTQNELIPTKNRIIPEKNLIMADKITKSYCISLAYGTKSVKKILSEKKISKRQRKVLPLSISASDPNKISHIPLSIFGLKDISSLS